MLVLHLLMLKVVGIMAMVIEIIRILQGQLKNMGGIILNILFYIKIYQKIKHVK